MIVRVLVIAGTLLGCTQATNRPQETTRWNAIHSVIERVKQTPARDLDDRLPPQPLQAWLRATLPKEWDLVWEYPDVCDSKREVEPPGGFPVCVRVSWTTRQEAVGRLLIQVGTTRSYDAPRVMNIVLVWRKAPPFDPERLADLPKAVRMLRGR